jgi:hypothetical protein
MAPSEAASLDSILSLHHAPPFHFQKSNSDEAANRPAAYVAMMLWQERSDLLMKPIKHYHFQELSTLETTTM